MSVHTCIYNYKSAFIRSFLVTYVPTYSWFADVWLRCASMRFVLMTQAPLWQRCWLAAQTAACRFLPRPSCSGTSHATSLFNRWSTCFATGKYRRRYFEFDIFDVKTPWEEEIHSQILDVLRPVDRQGAYQGETKCVATITQISLTPVWAVKNKNKCVLGCVWVQCHFCVQYTEKDWLQ